MGVKDRNVGFSYPSLGYYFTYADKGYQFSFRNPVYPLDVVDKLEEATMPKIDEYMTKKIAADKNNKCTLETAAVRREWLVFKLQYSLNP